jgi:hypothetical protein
MNTSFQMPVDDTKFAYELFLFSNFQVFFTFDACCEAVKASIKITSGDVMGGVKNGYVIAFVTKVSFVSRLFFS